MSGFMRTTGMLGLSKAELDERCRPSGYVMFLSPPKSNEMSLLWQLLLCLFGKKHVTNVAWESLGKQRRATLATAGKTMLIAGLFK